jgi:hypothetical protein
VPVVARVSSIRKKRSTVVATRKTNDARRVGLRAASSAAAAAAASAAAAAAASSASASSASSRESFASRDVSQV